MNKYLVILAGSTVDVESDLSHEEFVTSVINKIDEFGRIIFAPIEGAIVVFRLAKEQHYTLVVMNEKEAIKYKYSLLQQQGSAADINKIISAR